MKQFLQLFFNKLGQDPRPTRFYNVLCSMGEVTVCSAPPVPAFPVPDRFVTMPRAENTVFRKLRRTARLLSRRYEADIWTPQMRSLCMQFRNQQFFAIVCHDILLLPLACALRNEPQNKGQCSIVMDAREFYPRQFEHSVPWRVFLAGLNDYLCRTYLPQADLVFTVSPGLVKEYANEYGVSCQLLPSYPYTHEIVPHATSKQTIRYIHHGAASPGRKLELMVKAFAPLANTAELDFMLMPTDARYLEQLQQKSRPYPHIRFLDSVPMEAIVPSISSYDMGIFLLEPNTFNHKHTLPNKLFEFIQARLGVAVSPVPDMAGIVKEYGVGVVSADYSPAAMTKALQTLTASAIDTFKGNAHKAARDFCWERNTLIIKQKISNLL